jgi:alkanesulfonate monooxygenase SsuD/methylene tetrahydromethanopterin reductase-like flavin-dependent oxidoreductase (luciferase family)
LTWERRADAGPFRTISIGERVTFHNPDQLVALAAAAAVTTRARLPTNVSVLPIHPPALLAKSFATLDRLCDGRLIITPGVGARPEDFTAAGTTFTNRWQRLDDCVGELTRLWRGEPAEPGGEPVGPLPYQEGGPALHCSAQGPKALARAVRWAVGYQGFTTDGSREQLEAVAGRVTSAFEEAGRPRPELGVSCFFALGEQSLERLWRVVGKYYGFADPATQAATVAALAVSSPETIEATVANASAAGFDEVHFLPTTVDVAEIDRLEQALARC